MFKAWPRFSRTGWVYAGTGLIIVDLLLMVVRYLGVVFKTNAVAVLAVHHGVDAEAQSLLHLANILNMVRWKWIGGIFLLGVFLLVIGFSRPFFRRH
ncbi:hypothetical protein HHS34_006510 [Acidithiobacillus montserratensis]|uniref:Uncharacterized protein n=1 Tax=Acidithiobacillus montserratensis TaxID=2729135 RepID=A0ACD5HLQ3_9PROT|nr:hypothetical protein [Acidithiobacillaceae bacterium]MBU2749144.1 hypothetical protein [Acidithiobacillus montserratensis]